MKPPKFEIVRGLVGKRMNRLTDAAPIRPKPISALFLGTTLLLTFGFILCSNIARSEPVNWTTKNEPTAKLVCFINAYEGLKIRSQIGAHAERYMLQMGDSDTFVWDDGQE